MQGSFEFATIQTIFGTQNPFRKTYFLSGLWRRIILISLYLFKIREIDKNVANIVNRSLDLSDVESETKTSPSGDGSHRVVHISARYGCPFGEWGIFCS